MSDFKIYLCAIVKNEEFDIAEWILFHLFQGFDKICIYDNASFDETCNEIKRCSSYGSIEYVHWPYPHSQNKAYLDCIQRHRTDCDWMAFFDIDEFLVLPKHKYIKNFIASVEKYDAIGINWRMFGSSGHKTRPETLITEAFNRRAPDDFFNNRHIKSIVRPHLVSNVPNPHAFRLKRKCQFSFERHNYVSPNGRPLKWLKPGLSINAGEGDIARIHHYYTKSLEHYCQKLERGNADNPRKRHDLFEYHDRNDVLDNSIMEIYAEEIKRIREIKNTYCLKY